DHHKDSVWRASVWSITGIGVRGGKNTDSIVANYSELAKRLMMEGGEGRRLRYKLNAMAASTRTAQEETELPDTISEVKDRLEVLGMVEWIYMVFIKPYMPLLDALPYIPDTDYQPSITTIDRPTNHERICLQQTLLSLLCAHDHFHEVRYDDDCGDVDDE